MDLLADLKIDHMNNNSPWHTVDVGEINVTAAFITHQKPKFGSAVQ
jgi:hypothetical protein